MDEIIIAQKRKELAEIIKFVIEEEFLLRCEHWMDANEYTTLESFYKSVLARIDEEVNDA